MLTSAVAVGNVRDTGNNALHGGADGHDRARPARTRSNPVPASRSDWHIAAALVPRNRLRRQEGFVTETVRSARLCADPVQECRRVRTAPAAIGLNAAAAQTRAAPVVAVTAAGGVPQTAAGVARILDSAANGVCQSGFVRPVPRDRPGVPGAESRAGPPCAVQGIADSATTLVVHEPAASATRLRFPASHYFGGVIPVCR